MINVHLKEIYREPEITTPVRKNRKKITRISPSVKDQFSHWQTGDYDRQGKFHFTIPAQLLLLCRLMDLPPRQLLTDFMDNLSCGSWKREGREKAKEILVEYFLEHGYGRHIYSAGDIRAIFREMDAIGTLFPRDADPIFMEQHNHWRENYHAYWFSRWFRKFNRNI